MAQPKTIRQISFAQMRQRELAWLLYITEGYLANASHALAVNCVTFNQTDAALVERAIDRAQETADELRDLLKRIEAGG